MAQLITRLAQTDATLLSLEGFMVDNVNDERLRRQLPPLARDARLAAVARAHSGEMRGLGYFAHESPTPELRDLVARYILVFGHQPRLIAENIYQGQASVPIRLDGVLDEVRRAWKNAPRSVTRPDIEQAHQGLMESPGHCGNILRPDATHIGIGLVSNDSIDFWVTQMFSRP